MPRSSTRKRRMFGGCAWAVGTARQQSTPTTTCTASILFLSEIRNIIMNKCRQVPYV